VAEARRSRARVVLTALVAAVVPLLLWVGVGTAGTSPSTVFLTAWGWFVAVLLAAASLRRRRSGMLGR
jgi:MYXO-CTERM domain-containing protein